MAFGGFESTLRSLECVICSELLTDPRSLPCGHSLCGPKSEDKCIIRLREADGVDVRCPVCRALHEHSQQLLFFCKEHNVELCLTCWQSEHVGSGHTVEPCENLMQEFSEKWTDIKMQQPLPILEERVKELDDAIARHEQTLETLRQKRSQAIKMKVWWENLSKKAEDILASNNFDASKLAVQDVDDFQKFFAEYNQCAKISTNQSTGQPHKLETVTEAEPTPEQKLLETEATEDFQTFSNDDEEVSINPNEDAIPQNSKQADNMVSQQELEAADKKRTSVANRSASSAEDEASCSSQSEASIIQQFNEPALAKPLFCRATSRLFDSCGERINVYNFNQGSKKLELRNPLTFERSVYSVALGSSNSLYISFNPSSRKPEIVQFFPNAPSETTLNTAKIKSLISSFWKVKSFTFRDILILKPSSEDSAYIFHCNKYVKKINLASNWDFLQNEHFQNFWGLTYLWSPLQDKKVIRFKYLLFKFDDLLSRFKTSLIHGEVFTISEGCDEPCISINGDLLCSRIIAVSGHANKYSLSATIYEAYNIGLKSRRSIFMVAKINFKCNETLTPTTILSMNDGIVLGSSKHKATLVELKGTEIEQSRRYFSNEL